MQISGTGAVFSAPLPTGHGPEHTNASTTAAETREAPLAATVADEEENTDQVAFEAKEELMPWDLNYEKPKNPFTSGTSGLKDSSGPLTARLVSATSEMMVRGVVSSAYKELLSLRIAATTGDDDAARAKAAKLLAKMEKLLDRCYEKIDDLNREMGLDNNAKKAAERMQERLERQIKDELRHEERKRRAKEDGYLREQGGGGQETAPYTPTGTGPLAGGEGGVSEAQIAAEARAMATTQVAAATGGANLPGGTTTAAAAAGYQAATGAASSGGSGAEGGAAEAAGGVDIVV